MPQISNLILLLSAISLAFLGSCRPAENERFDFIQEGGLSLLDFPLLSSNEALEESLEPSQSVLGSTDPLFATSLSGPVSTTFTLDISLNPNSSPNFYSSPVSSQIADGTLCPGANRYAFCCKGEKCVRTAECYSDEDLNCCTVDPGNDEDKTPYDCQPPSASSSQDMQNVSDFSTIFAGQLPNDFDSRVSEDFLGEIFDDFPINFPKA